jgi:putative transposase
MDTGTQSHRKLCKRYDVPWHGHYLTFSCFKQQPFFSGRFTTGWFLENLDVARKVEPFDIWAYVVMPEHVHLFILPNERSRIDRILWRIKKPFSDRILEWVGSHNPSFLRKMEHRRMNGRVVHRFWQPGGGYDRNMWTVSMIHEKIRYIHENPVRRGLVQKAEDWPWSSARAWSDGTDQPLWIDRQSVPIWIQ